MNTSVSKEAPRHSPSAAVADFDAIVMLQKLRIAIVHYWFVNRRGGERVVETMADMFPAADLFALIVDRNKLNPSLRSRPIRTSFLQKIPFARHCHRHFLPLYPFALEQFDLSAYDLVLSSESGPAKGVVTRSTTRHVCYCHSPMRYLWDFYHSYRDSHGMGLLSKSVFTMTAPILRIWDSECANRVDHFVANSETVAARIRKHYRRSSSVIHPPVNTAAGFLTNRIGNYYLTVGQLVGYKRIDVAIEACNHLRRPLHVVGDGEQYRALRRLAGPTVTFCGALSEADLYEQYAHCRALLFPGEEDFGMVPVEAMSCGRPVIAYARGGATETVKGMALHHGIPASSASGVFFDELKSDSLAVAILKFEQYEADFIPTLIQKSTERFSEKQFRDKFARFLFQLFASSQPGPAL